MAFACPTSSWKSCENSMCIISTRFDFIVLVSSFRARNSTPCDFVAKYIWKKNTNIHTDYSATGETPIFSILCSSVGSWGHWLQPSRPCRASEPFASQLGSWYFRLSLQKNPLRDKAALVSWQKHGTGQTLQVASAIISCCQSNGNLNQNKMTRFWANDTILLCIYNVVNHAKPNHQSPIEQCYTTQITQYVLGFAIIQ